MCTAVTTRRAVSFPIALIVATTFSVIWVSGSQFGSPARCIGIGNIDWIVGVEGTLHRLAYLVAEHAPIPCCDCAQHTHDCLYVRGIAQREETKEALGLKDVIAGLSSGCRMFTLMRAPAERSW